MENNLIAIIGATATGKTELAAHLAYEINGEIISADSRQVYKGMNLGTGKDLEDYTVKGKKIPYHLVDIVEAGYEYNVYEYINDFYKAYNKIIKSGKTPILCGGSGMYAEAVLKGYDLKYAPISEEIRENFRSKTDNELIDLLKGYKALHNVTDTKDRNRLIRAVEIAFQRKSNGEEQVNEGFSSPFKIFGIHFEREVIIKRITERLDSRLKAGMVEEVKALLDKGIPEEKLKYYGLEYKFITMFLKQEIDYNTMFEKLNIAIHQFSKRQMTWFRKMEREGLKINWIDGKLDIKDKVTKIKGLKD